MSEPSRINLPNLATRLEAVHDRLTGHPGSGAALKSKLGTFGRFGLLLSGIEAALAKQAPAPVSQGTTIAPAAPAPAARPAAPAAAGDELAEYTRLQQSGKAAEAGEYYQAHAEAILKQKAQANAQAIADIQGQYPWNKLRKAALVLVAAVSIAFILPSASAQSAGGELLSAMPSVLGAGAATNWIPGTTMQPVDLSSVQNITWEVTGACTNGTSTATIVFVLFSSQDVAGWPGIVTNCTQVATRVWTIPLDTQNRTFSTNFFIGAYRYMVPLYATNASQMWTNATLRYSIKPGF